MYEDLKEQTRNSFNELCETAQFKPGSLIVVGGSSSEVRGGVIGKDSSYEVGKTVTSTIIEEAGKRHLRLAFQCCEHLNRALIMEREDAEFFGYDEVTVVPWLHAGGAFSTSAFYQFKDPVAVERVAASGGIDIGLTMIGMHLKRVAVPIRLKANRIGQAYVSGAKTRPPLIGGERAHYTREDGMD
ncbi:MULTISPECIES: TIGR01440 family protein [Dialister]|jgi:uncharacterized protein (TIGR01440 family)|uniref:UPF0340 protein Dia5BBH33_07880 n=2 Tax=Dialister hominis TaxID=2582419 RepID=A0A8E4BST4_9FIRM|nr:MULTISPECIES: TIGR01440 family protein [Dialister]MEE1348780.1 TIGR01440 family protein [Dialister hominis]UYJ16495.1 MAG: TIGR01440 family protein [Veillonellaceae bacterium]BBK24853.1 UPF0340 protein [Dialister hominis]CDD81055.1 uPF0340 protein GCWU000321_00127 [Dialister sp. CAG:357]